MQLDLSVLRWFDNKPHNKYPHLAKSESELWTDFIQPVRSGYGARML